LEQAKAAAYEATAEIFDNDKPAALQEQSKVIGSLAEIEEQLKHALDLDDANKSADQLAKELEKLQEVQKGLEQAAQEQAKAEQAAAKDPSAAKQAEKAVAEAVAKVSEGEIPGTVESRLQDVQEAVA